MQTKELKKGKKTNYCKRLSGFLNNELSLEPANFNSSK